MARIRRAAALPPGIRRAVAILVGFAVMATVGVAPAQEMRPSASEAKPIEVTPQMVEVMRRVAEQGDPSAQITLGFFYEGGQGVAASFDQAAVWYEKAAQSGSARGAQLLGLLHGRNDWPKAKALTGLGWLETAVALGRTEAEPARDRMAQRLSPPERQSAVAFARSKIAEINAKSGQARP
jgi:TPR repeat protein